MPQLTLYDQLGDIPILGAIEGVRRGSWPVGRRGGPVVP